MQVTITGQVGDSSAAYATGRIEFSQVQRLDTGEMLVTSVIATANVTLGRLTTLSGQPFQLPSNPEGTAVRVREILGGETFEWYTAVPAEESIEYRMLPLVESESLPESVWGPPPWIAQVEQMRDETILAIEEGTEVAEALGGLAGINAAVTAAQTAATDAGFSAITATSEANRAEAAASSIDMSAINARLDDIGAKADGAVAVPTPAPLDGSR